MPDDFIQVVDPVKTFVCFVTCLLLLGVAVVPATADEAPIQLSLLEPIQLRSADTSIKGVKLNLLYGKNANMTGLEWSFIAGHNTGNVEGVQWGLVNITDGTFLGWQAGLVNFANSDFTGYQLGLFNRTRGTTKAFQWGWVNVAESGGGLMLGFVNYAKTMDGLQIGLVNIISSKDNLPVLPIVNWTF